MNSVEELELESIQGLEDSCPDCFSTMVCPSCNPEEMTAIDKDMRNLARMASEQEARFLVDNYYMAQGNRIRAASQIRDCKKEGESTELLQVNLNNFRFAENQLFKILDEYSNSKELGVWARSIHGIGPVITAGLLAHINLDIAKTPASVWRFAGYDPTSEWKKNEKRPFNAKLKVLCFKIGESFEKVQNSDKDFYGHLLAQRKEYEIANNESGKFAETAEKAMSTGSYKKETVAKKAYESGMLPAGQIRMRAKRWAVKLFLSHYWEVGKAISGDLPSDWKPWVIAIGGHQKYVSPPNKPPSLM